MTDHLSPASEAVEAAREAIDAAIAEFKAAPPREVLETAGQFGELLIGRHSDVSRLRAAAAAQLRKDEDLSFSELAEAIGGVSKGRAAQLVRWAEGGFRHDPKPHRPEHSGVEDKKGHGGT